jgi:hypothetical protein
MDHLPKPTSIAPAGLLEVPLLCTTADVELYITSPRQIYSHSRQSSRRPIQWNNLSINDAAFKAQTELYFGLLFDHHIRPENFSRAGPDPSIRYVDSSNLNKISFPEQSLTYWQPILGHVQQELNSLQRSFPLSARTEIVHLVALSTRILIEALQQAYLGVVNVESDKTAVSTASGILELNPPGRYGAILQRRMRASHGWCPKFVADVLEDYSWATCYYLSSLARPTNKDHEACTESSCNHKVSHLNYPFRHCETGCNCTRLEVDVKDITRRGRIPLVRLRSDGRGHPTIEVVEAEYDTRYIAVTHTWAGGLGNPQSNALYTCQLEKLARAGVNIRDLAEKELENYPHIHYGILKLRRRLRNDIGLFWIDTLCIPTREFDENNEQTDASRNLRAMALDQMTQTYAGAHSVLVVDPELRQIPGNMPREELFARILCSPWMSRCWTFQEAAMGPRIFVMWADGFGYLDLKRSKIIEDRERNRSVGMSSQSIRVADEVSSWLSEFPTVRKSRRHDTRQEIEGNDPSVFSCVWNNLARRNTNRSQDRLTILALMVNVLPSDLLNQENQDEGEKLRSILNGQTMLPIAFLFLDHCNEPLDHRPDYWLPTKMEGKRISDKSGCMIRWPERGNTLVFNRSLAFKGPKKPCMYIAATERLSTGKYSVNASNGGRMFNFEIEFRPTEYIRQTAQEMVLLLSDDTFMAAESMGDREIPGACLISKGERHLEEGSSERFDHEWHLTYICPILCRNFGPVSSTNHRRPMKTLQAAHHEISETTRYMIDCGRLISLELRKFLLMLRSWTRFHRCLLTKKAP